MAPRYLFLCPDNPAPSGGVAVIYDTVAQLRADGHDAVLLHMGPAGRYPNSPHVLPTLYATAIVDAIDRRKSLARRIVQLPQRIRRLSGSRRNQPLRERPDDIYVVPDFMLSLAAEALPGRRRVIFVQNPFIYLEAFADALSRGMNPHEGHLLSIGGSRICMDSFELTGASPTAYCRVLPDFAKFPFRAEKRRKIAYMPRKRREEAGLLRAALERRGNLHGYELVCVDGMTLAQVAEVMGESLFFLSLMKRESLGFPGLEAMAAGCIVVGYTGIGAREYFTPETGIPVEEDDTHGLVTALEQAVAEYERDPARLDALRRHAAATVTATYSQDAFVTGLRDAWADLVARL